MAVQQAKVTIDGQEYTLTLNEATGKYEATITAPSLSSYNQAGHYYGVEVSVTDDSGNETVVNSDSAALGEQCRLVVKETTAPVITLTSPTQDQTTTNSSPTIAFTVTDNDSGVNPDAIKVFIDGKEYASDITKTTINNGYTCTFVAPNALQDGAHEVYVTASDFDGNATTTETVAFKVDTTPPELSVSSPVDGLHTNASSVTVIGTTNDITSSPVILTVNGENVTVGSNGGFTHTVALTEGTNTITIVATDAAGKTTTVMRTIMKNTKAPEISAVTINPNPVNAGNVFTISVTVTDE